MNPFMSRERTLPWNHLQRVITAAAVAASIVALPAVGHAQTRSVLIGTITAQDGSVLPNAAISVASPSLPGGPVSTTTGPDGTWRVPELLPGTYVVTAAAAGFQTVEHRDVRVSATGTVTIDHTLPVADVAESVVVIADRPIVDGHTPATVTTVDRELLDALPLRRTNTYATTFLLPGVNQNAVNGAYHFGLDFRVDGMPMNDARQGGTSTPSVFSNRWFEEVQFAGLGAAAEYGESLGGTANMTLRSGGERTSGLLDLSGTGQDWVSDNRGSLSPALQERFRPLEIDSNWDGAAQVGGELGTNRAFFFSGYEYLRDDALPAGAPIGAEPVRFRQHRGITRLLTVPADGLRVEGSVVRTVADRLAGNTSPTTAPEAIRDLRNEYGLWSARATWASGPRTLVEVRAGRLTGINNFRPRAPATRFGPPPHVDLVTGVTSVNISQYFFLSSERRPVSAAITHVLGGTGTGTHTIKAGVEVERLVNSFETGHPGGRLFQDRAGEPDQVILWDGDVTGQRGTRTSIYAQDTWQLSPSLTLSPGVRVTVYRSSVAGRGTVYSPSGVGPRFGLAWRPLGSNETVVRAAYGRVYDTLFGRMTDFMATDTQTARITARVLGPETFEELNRVTPATDFGIDESIRHPFVDDWVVGIERAVARSLNVRAQYAYRTFGNLLAYIDTGSVYEPVQRRDPGGDNVLGTADDGDPITVFSLTNPGQAFFLKTNPEDAWRDYHGLTFAADKRLADNWQVLASYTWSRTRGTVGNEGGSQVGEGESGRRSGYFANPNAAVNVGLPRYDFPHEIKVQGLGRFPRFDTTLAVTYLYLTGEPWGRLATIRDLAQGNQTIRIEPRGVRRLGATNNLDFRLEQPVRVAGSTASLYVDLLNATNRGFATRVTDRSGGAFGVPSRWSTPRTVRFGARVQF